MLIIWDFKPSGEPFLLTEGELPQNTVSIRSETGHNTVLEQVDAHKGVRILGVRQAGSLQMDTEFDHQHGKTYKFGCATVICPLQQHEIFLSYRTIYIPSLTYSFAATLFTAAQNDKLIAALNPKLLPRLGYNQTTPKAL
eukprot:6114404-Ditylum_brightwellii.AAC.1